MTKLPANRPGRPSGPTENRGERPYDPRWSTPKRQRIIASLHRHRSALEFGELTLCDLAAMIGTSLSYLSIVKNSPWGQRQLQALAKSETDQGAPV